MHKEATQVEIISSLEDKGKRLDKFLTERLPYLSRARLQQLIREGAVVQKNVKPPLKISAKLEEGDSFLITLPPPEPSAATAQPMALDIAYEDEALIVINKPAGLCVHPDPAHRDGTLVNGLLHHCAGKLSGIGGVERPGIVHRLDKNTSGLLVCAKTERAHLGLAKQFAAHGKELQREYLALVWGKPAPGITLIDEPIGRSPRNREKMAVLNLTHKFGSGKRARAAQTEFQLLERVGDKASLVRCRLFTGRTHQIRVHLRARGFAVVGDNLYKLRRNNYPAPIERQALHATTLGFIHPVSGEALAFNAPPPEDFQAAIKKLQTTYPL